MSDDSRQSAQAIIHQCPRLGWKVDLQARFDYWADRYGFVTVREGWALTERGARRKADRWLRLRRRQIKRLGEAYEYREGDA